MSMTSKRLETIALRELAMMLRNDEHKGLNIVNITEVTITPDLAFMNIFYTVLNDSDKEKAAELLADNKGFIRSELAKKLDARKVPELNFKYDEALANGNRINDILASLNSDKE